MIAKRIDKQANITGSFGGLARYIANVLDDGEKLDYLKSKNFNSSGFNENINDELDSLQNNILEANYAQSQNKSAKTDKTYHLLVSFRAGEKPTPEQIDDIENQYAKALGFESHQRIIACHANTDNYHIHIAYNRVNPDNYKLVSPKHDFIKLAKLTREIELQYGFTITNGMTDSSNNKSKVQNKSDDIEKNTWQQSLYSYCREIKPELQKIITNSTNWQDLHDGFNNYGLQLSKKGNGLIITDINHNKKIKPSSIDRAFSLPSLEKRLGKFCDSTKKLEKSKCKSLYEAKPLTNHEKTREYFDKFKEFKKNKSKSLYKLVGLKNSELRKAGVIANSYRLFLQYLALDGDMLAMAIMYLHKQIFKTLTAPAKTKNIIPDKVKGMEI